MYEEIGVQGNEIQLSLFIKFENLEAYIQDSDMHTQLM